MRSTATRSFPDRPSTAWPTGNSGLGLNPDDHNGRPSPQPPPCARARPAPARSDVLCRWFRWWVRGYLRKHFHAVRLARGTCPDVPADWPLIVVLNHPSWWDPLIGTMLAVHFPEHAHYAPMEANALRGYSLFDKLGFYGVDPGTQRGAVAFLRTTTAILSRPRSAVWITAEGRFTDPRSGPRSCARRRAHRPATG